MAVNNRKSSTEMKSKQLFSDSNGKYTLYSIPWYTECEQVKWGANYRDIDLPFGLHLWETVEYCQTNVPVLVNEKQEVFSTTTDINMYMYSQAFSGKIRIYSNPESLGEQEYLDSILAPAVRRIYLTIMISDKELMAKYFFQSNWLNKWNVLNSITWPILEMIIKRKFQLDSKSIKESWQIIEKVCDHIDEKLQQNQADGKSGYLYGKNLSAADISFASHISLLLFPNDDELKGYGGQLGIQIPKIEELTIPIQSNIMELKSHESAKFAMRLYAEERGMKRAQKIDRDLKMNPQSWEHQSISYFRSTMVNICMQFIVATLFPTVLEVEWYFQLGIYLSLFIFYYLMGYYNIDTLKLFKTKLVLLYKAQYSDRKVIVKPQSNNDIPEIVKSSKIGSK
ncbi:hypothetical protein HDV02_001442 [Globomyces sp. JEL0801]|nr:hypothetical protein HDV02_001442 [Globomyces sp. JEL0801]